MNSKGKKFFIMKETRFTIKHHLLIVYFLLIVLPLNFFTVLTYNEVSKVVHDQTIASASQSFKECIVGLEKYLKDMNTIMINLLDSPEVYKLAEEDPLKYYLNTKGVNNVIKFMAYLKNTTDITNIGLYSQSYYSTNGTDLTYSIDDLHERLWYKKLIQDQKNRMWFSPLLVEEATSDDIVFSYVSRIFKIDEIEEELAIIKIDLSKKNVLDILERTAFTPNSSTYIFNESGVILSSRESSSTWQDFEKLLQNTQTDKWIKGTINNENVFYNLHINRLTGWYFLSIIPVKDITYLGDGLRIKMLTTMFLIAIFSYLLAYLISDSSVRRLSLLTHQMKRVEEGNIDVQIMDKGKDEISELIYGFNSMVSKISVLNDEKYAMGIEVKNLELKALQAQINPHFLYNSLDLINCLAIKYDIKEIREMVNALSKFYKISLSNGKEVINLSDEIEHVSHYLSIQNLRYKDKINFVKEIDEGLYEYKILKIILQPIVENAIIHGIFSKEIKTGTIIIKGKLEGQTIILTVSDDGVGMSEEVVSNILVQDQSKAKHGYGVYNTDARLRIKYGNQYGLQYESKLGIGTNVTIHFPAIK